MNGGPLMFDSHQLNRASGVQRLALATDKSVWISASAGTGKTEVLTRRMLALLLRDATLEPRQLLALTFTKAGAAEMAARLPQRLDAWAALDDAALARTVEDTLGFVPEAVAARVRTLAAQVRQAPPLVATIHGLAQQLLGRFAVEAGLEPGFEVIEGGAQKRLLAEVQNRLLVEVDGALAESLMVLLDDMGDYNWRELSGDLAKNWRRLQERLADGGAAGLLARVKAGLGLQGEDTSAAPLVPDEAEWAALRRMAQALPGHAVQHVVNARGEGVEAAWRAFLLKDKGEGPARKLTPWFTKADRAAVNEADVEMMLAAAARVAEGVRLRKVWRGYAITEALVIWAAAVKAAYAAEKRARGVVDFDDLLNGLERLLAKAGDGLDAWLWYGFDRRFRHLMVDEGQDNNPQQDRIVQWLARNILSGDVGEASARTVLAVGDVKQSIYRFQGAEPGLFVGLKEALGAWAPSGGLVEIDFTHNFRSGPEILALVNDVFRPAELAAQVMGTTRDVAWLEHRAVAAARPSRVELWPLVPKPAPAEVEPWALPWVRAAAAGDGADARLFGQLAAWLEDKLGRVVMPSKDPAKGPTTLQPEDVLVLVKTNVVGAAVASALRAAGLPVASADGMVPLAVQDVVALLRVVFNRADNVALAQVLKGFRRWDDARLLAVAATAGRDGVWADHLEGDARAWLEGWAARAWEAPLALAQAALVERGGRRSDFEGLLGWAADCANLRALVARCEQEEIPMASDGAGIRILTVQRAKGLQAPLVVMPQTLTSGQTDKLLWGEGTVLKRSGKDVSAFEDGLLADNAARRAEDDLRGLYVALTRACDWLVVAGFGDKKDTSATWWGRVDAVDGWREEGGVRVRGADFTRVDRTVAVSDAVDVPAWVTAPVRGVEAVEPQTPAQVRGELVHALLQGLPMAAEPGVVAEVMAVKAALPWVFGPGRSEVSVALDGGGVGRIDRLVEKDGELWVIDFKTGEAAAAMPAAYAAQVAGYVAAVRASYPARTVRGAVVWTATATLVPVA